MNAENIAKALKCCYPPEGANTCEGCPYDGIEDPSCTERNIEYKAGEIIESLLSQLDAAIAGQETLQKAFTESVETNRRVVGERELLRERYAEVEEENIAWNDANCDTCPLIEQEACDEICASKARLLDYIAESQRREQVLWENLEDAVSKNAGCVLCVHEFGWRPPEEGEPHETV